MTCSVHDNGYTIKDFDCVVELVPFQRPAREFNGLHELFDVMLSVVSRKTHSRCRGNAEMTM